MLGGGDIFGGVAALVHCGPLAGAVKIPCILGGGDICGGVGATGFDAAVGFDAAPSANLLLLKSASKTHCGIGDFAGVPIAFRGGFG